MIVESYLKGVSTRKVEAVISALDIELSHTTVSNLSHELDELITEFKHHPCGLITLIYMSMHSI